MVVLKKIASEKKIKLIVGGEAMDLISVMYMSLGIHYIVLAILLS